jgi:hypothetical protein
LRMICIGSKIVITNNVHQLTRRKPCEQHVPETYLLNLTRIKDRLRKA